MSLNHGIKFILLLLLVSSSTGMANIWISNVIALNSNPDLDFNKKNISNFINLSSKNKDSSTPYSKIEKIYLDEKYPPGKVIKNIIGNEITYELITGDQLSLSLSSDGNVSGIAIDNYQMLFQEQEPFTIITPPGNSSFASFLGGVVTQLNDSALQQTGQVGNFALQCDYNAGSEYIAITFTIQTIIPMNASLDLEFALPINATGWYWWTDLLAPQEINSSNNSYENILTPPGYTLGSGKINKYPYALLSNDNCGLAYALDLKTPVNYLLGYNLSTLSYYTLFSLGLSNLPIKLSNKATLSFILYRSDPNWGLRSTVDRYYHFFPMYFDNSRCVGASHAFSIDAVSLIPREVEIGYGQGGYNRFNESTSYGGLYGCVNWFDGLVDECYGIKSLQYINAGQALGFPILIPGNITQMEILEQYRTANESIYRDLYRVALNSYITNALGLPVYSKLYSQYDPPYFELFINTDPEIADYTQMDFFFEYFLRPSFLDNEVIGISIDGVMADNQGPPSIIHPDYNTSHFYYVDYPLTYDATTNAIVISPISYSVESMKYLRNILHSNFGEDKLIMGNMGVAFPHGIFQTPYIDVFLMEAEFDHWGAINNDLEIQQMRMFANQKTIVELDYNALTSEIVEQEMCRLLPYGVFPQSGGNWTRDLDLYNRYLPIFQQLYNAGWQPITAARASENGDFSSREFYLERFGSNINNDLYFVLRDIKDPYAEAPRDITITIPTIAFNLTEDYLIEELVSNSLISYSIVHSSEGDIIVFDTTIENGKSLVFRVFKPDYDVTNFKIDTINPIANNHILLIAQGTYICTSLSIEHPSIVEQNIARFYDNQTIIDDVTLTVINATHWEAKLEFNPGSKKAIHHFTITVDPNLLLPEWDEENNEATLIVELPLIWHYKQHFVVNTLEYNRQEVYVKLNVNFTDLFEGLSIYGNLDLNSLRVFDQGQNKLIACQFLIDYFNNFSYPGLPNGDIIFLLKTASKQTSLDYYLLFDTLENGIKPPQNLFSPFLEVTERHVRSSSNQLIIFSPISGGILRMQNNLERVTEDFQMLTYITTQKDRGSKTETFNPADYFQGKILDSGPLAIRIVQKHSSQGVYEEFGSIFTIYSNGIIEVTAYIYYNTFISYDRVEFQTTAPSALPPLLQYGYYYNETTFTYSQDPVFVNQTAYEYWYGYKAVNSQLPFESQSFLTTFIVNDPLWFSGTIIPFAATICALFEPIQNISSGQHVCFSIYYFVGNCSIEEITIIAQSLLPIDIYFAQENNRTLGKWIIITSSLVSGIVFIGVISVVISYTRKKKKLN